MRNLHPYIFLFCHMKYRALLALVFLLPAGAQAQQPWDIEQCIEHAVGHNLQVQQGLKAVQSSRIDRSQTRLNYLPNLSAGASHNFSHGRSLDPTTYEYVSGKSVNNVSGSLSLSTQLFGGLQKAHNLRRADFSLRASVQDVERIKNEITVAVTAAYLQVLYIKEQITVSQNQLEVLQSQLERTRKLVEAGSVPLGSRLELEAQLAAEQYNLVTYRNQRINALLDLAQLLELRDVPQFDVAVPDSARLEVLMEAKMLDHLGGVNAVYTAAQGLPQVEVQKLRYQVARKDVALARARYYPTLSFGASYGSSWSDARSRPQLPGATIDNPNYPFFDQFRDNASEALQFGLSVPIFGGLTTRNNVRKSKIALQHAALGVRIAEDRLYKDIQQAWTDASGALERYRSATSSVTSNAESFRYAAQKFEAGATTAVDYNLAKNNLIEARSMQVRARYDYIFKLKILDFYRGVPITL